MTRILDCTFRDGGYQTDWFFETESINNYFDSLIRAGITHSELGFRFANSANTFGPFAFTTSQLIDSLNVPESLNIGVMLNAGDVIENEQVSASVLRKLFPQNESRLNFIRIAAHFHELKHVTKISDSLRRDGVEVHLNIMKSSNLIDHPESWDLLTEVNLNAFTDVAIADSLGKLLPENMEPLVKGLRDMFKGKIGIHMHDNFGLALANSLAAARAGADSIDATIGGIGRGAGNTRTEFAAALLSDSQDYPTYNPDPLLDLSAEFFEPLNTGHGWGPNSLYFLSALGGVHPTYAQDLSNNGLYSSSEILATVRRLKDVGGANFSPSKLASVMPRAEDFYEPTSEEYFLTPGWCRDRDIVLIGGGDFVAKNSSHIEKHLDKNSEKIVISMNLRSGLSDNLIDYFIIADPIKISLNSFSESSLKKKLIVRALPESLSESANFHSVSYFKTTPENSLEIDEEEISGDSADSFAYALAAISFGDARSIQLVGFDGYSGNPSRHNRMQILLDNFYTQNQKQIELYLGTPTTYSGPQKSFFS